MAPLLRVYRDTLFYMHRDPFGRHMESPRRLKTAYNALAKSGVLSTAEEVPAPRPGFGVEVFTRIHDESYVHLVVKTSLRGGGYLDADTYVNEYTVDAALAAAASALDAAYYTLETGVPSLVLARPPGHHAGRYGAAMGAPTLGFCIFNITALTAKTLADKGLRVLVVDFDLHHGNGTQEILYDDPRIVHVDLHQDPSTIYPGTGWPWETGEGEAEGTKLNLVLPPGSGDDVFQFMAEKALELAVDIMGSPDIVLVDAGFDGYQGDGLGWLKLTSNSYRAIARLLKEAARHIVVVLEGGYSLGLVRGLPSFIGELAGLHPGIEEEPTTSSTSTWEEARENLSRLCRAIGRSYCS